MKIGLLEHHQDPSESPRLISAAKANRLLHEFKIAVHITPRLIKLTIAKSWTVVRAWLRDSVDVSKELRTMDAVQEQAELGRARAQNPNGAMFNFGRWPSADQRTVSA